MTASKRLTPLAIILLGVVLAIVPPAKSVRACGIAPPRGFEATVADETALIVYDSATKTEHFLRTAKFDTTSADFGFFVPTPSQPELAEASADIFPILGKITEPITVYRTVRQEASFACGGVASSNGRSGVGATMPAGVRVLERKRVGAFDAAVLKAENVRELRDWLKENEYGTRPALEAWFGEYIRLGWFITAFKIAGGSPNTASVNSPVRLSFKTDVPVYPYREPLDQQAPRKSYPPRLFRLFVLSDARVEGKLGRGEDATGFVGKTVWSKLVGAGMVAPALAAGKFPAMTGDWHLTEFEDMSDPRKGTDDLYFSKSLDQLPVERPPHEIVTVETTYWGLRACCSGFIVAGLTLLYCLIWSARRVVRRAKQSATRWAGDQPAGDLPMPKTVHVFRVLCAILSTAGAIGMPCSLIALTDTFNGDPELQLREFAGFFCLALAVCILYAVPLLVARDKPWMYWYGMGIIALLALSLYGIPLAIGLLVFWLRPPTMAYFGQVHRRADMMHH